MEVKEEKDELAEEVEDLPEPAEHTHISWVIAVAVLGGLLVILFWRKKAWSLGQYSVHF